MIIVDTVTFKNGSIFKYTVTMKRKRKEIFMKYGTLFVFLFFFLTQLRISKPKSNPQ